MAVQRHEFDSSNQQDQKQAKRSRITFDVSPELRRRIKVAAAQQNASIGEYLGHIIEEVVPKEIAKPEQPWRPITRKSSEKLRTIRERLLTDHDGEPFEDSTETIRERREDRVHYLEETQKENREK